MSTNKRTFWLIVTGAAILFSLACGSTQVPATQLPQPPSAEPAQTTAPSQTLVMLPTETPLPAPSATATQLPTSPPTLTPTKMPTLTPTRTALPSLPDFDKLISYGSGGGGKICTEDRAPDTIEINTVKFGSLLVVCFWLQSLDPNQPFDIRMEAMGSVPAGPASLQSPALSINWSDALVSWEGHDRPDGQAGRTNDGALALYDFMLWLPETLSPGQWRIFIQQQGGMVDNLYTTFQIEKKGQPYLSAFGIDSQGEFLQSFNSYFPYHLLKPGNDGRITVQGSGFPASQMIYLLVYREDVVGLKASLMKAMAVQTDPTGSIGAELDGPFDSQRAYLVIGVSDPNTPFTGDNAGEKILDLRTPLDYFLVEGALPTACPGAIPQRMRIGQNGYVCTKKDPVRLRDTPNRSGNVINMLDPGTQLTVLNGPVCADAWSWWQIRTEQAFMGWVSEGAGDAEDPYYICPQP
jgi:hypothetical protein